MNERASTKVHYCDAVYLSSVEHSKSIGFSTEVYLISGAVSDISNLVPRAFPDLRVFESASGVMLVVAYT